MSLFRTGFFWAAAGFFFMGGGALAAEQSQDYVLDFGTVTTGDDFAESPDYILNGGFTPFSAQDTSTDNIGESIHFYGGCGDRKIDGDEVCDGGDFGGLSCKDFGFEEGILHCSNQCDQIFITGCGNTGGARPGGGGSSIFLRDNVHENVPPSEPEEENPPSESERTPEPPEGELLPPPSEEVPKGEAPPMEESPPLPERGEQPPPPAPFEGSIPEIHPPLPLPEPTPGEEEVSLVILDFAGVPVPGERVVILPQVTPGEVARGKAPKNIRIITLFDGEKQEDTADETGNFSVPLPQNLKAGTHTALFLIAVNDRMIMQKVTFRIPEESLRAVAPEVVQLSKEFPCPLFILLAFLIGFFLGRWSKRREHQTVKKDSKLRQRKAE